MSFVHLHTHSEYSLLDGANQIPELVAHVKKLGMDSLAVTDHGNMHAAWEFYEEAKKQKIRPILGFEAYLSFGPRTAREKPQGAPAPYSHLVLLARNRAGYRNLIRLTSIGFTEGFYRRPRIDKEVLAAHSEGIVCLAACLSGEVALHLRQGKYDEARMSAEWFSRTFGTDGFWLEIQQHGIGEERVVTEGMLRLGQDLGLPVVATNDAHYLRREDAEAHDVLLAIGTGSDLDDPKRFRFTGQESYVKSEAEMQTLFPDHLDTLANTSRVAELCEFDFEKRYFLPEFPLPAKYQTDEALLNHLANDGAIRRYGAPLPPEVQHRLGYELGVINKAGYAGYFLIVQDFIAAARERGIPVGPGRGSAAGSIVAYALGITDVCPLKFDLLFERFLNPERVSMPDIDVDFCFERRGEVIEYVRGRYGRASVGQIVTFGTMKARAAVKDVARVLRIPPGEADRITKLIPSGPAYNLPIREAATKVDELRDLVRDNPSYQRLIKLSSRIEGISRHMSVHAAGVVIAPGPLSEYVPVCTAPTKGAGAAEGDSIITQYEMGALEKVGMLKMDLLGLKTLTVIHDAVNMIADRHGTRPEMDTLTFDDPLVYEMLRHGRTAGVFQFESPLATDTLRAMKCDRFDDLVASNALLRPGPLDAGMHTVFIRRKLGLEKVTYPHPALQEVLEPTYGVITYQEQVMRIANVLAGFSLAEADVLRKAVGKKDQELANQEVAKFVERAVAQGHPRPMVEELGRQIVTFGRYGFNKSHSVAYSVLSYRTAWLKAHYPAEFMAALLSSEIGNTDKVVQYINEARELGLEILPPDVNESGFKFTVVGERRIRFGLGAVRNVGEGAIESIIAGRVQAPYTTLAELVERIDLRLCNKRVLESLVAAGACDSLGGHRKQLIEALEAALAEAQLLHQEREAGQGSLFGEVAKGGNDENVNGSGPRDLPAVPSLPEIPAWSEAERLAKEKEVLGFFISGHPLERYRQEVELFGTRTTATLGEWGEHQVSVAAVVTGVKRQISKKTGKEYARLVLEDFHGTAEAIVFPDAWAKLNQTILPDSALLLTGGYSDRDRGEDQAPFIVEVARELSELKSSGALALSLRWRSPSAPEPSALQAAAALCSAHPGPTPIYIDWSDGNGEAIRLRSRRVRVAAEDDLVRALRDLLGTESVHYVKAG
ncbi:MAG TPA: DNA polymerase III subunit alpha [Gemmatimonadales bacterium]|nr:DNA polymerase III subunit alpha [Gemmatimonadales bacterium]